MNETAGYGPVTQDWRKWWLISYAIGLTLIPPIHFHNRLIFAPEWLLIPLFVGMIGVFSRGEIIKPSKALLFVWGACVLTFVAGFLRGDLATKISIYDLKEFKYFSLKDDGIVFLRMTIIFSTSWFLKNVLQKDRSRYLQVFMNAFKICMLISAILALLDERALGLINLRNWGYFDIGYEFWSARARGTFYTPIDASFMYGVSAAYLLFGPEPLVKNYLNLTVLAFSLLATVLTHGGTAMGSLLICLGGYLYFGRSVKGPGSKKELYISIALITLGVIIALIILPHQFLHNKYADFVYRFQTYRNYLSFAPKSPWILIIGIGFSRLCADNNFILLFIQGGILFFVAILNWVRALLMQVPKAFIFIFLYWVLTWFGFDTLTYWGIGRFCWFLLGLV